MALNALNAFTHCTICWNGLLSACTTVFISGVAITSLSSENVQSGTQSAGNQRQAVLKRAPKIYIQFNKDQPQIRFYPINQGKSNLGPWERLEKAKQVSSDMGLLRLKRLLLLKHPRRVFFLPCISFSLP